MARPIRTLLALASFVLALMVPLGCSAADAQQPEAGPVTAGPSLPIDLEPNVPTVITLEASSDPAAVVQTEGLIIGAAPVLISAAVMFHDGAGTAAIQLGNRELDEWRTVAVATNPANIAPVIVYPHAGEVARLVVTSAFGGRIRSGVEPRQTYLTAIPLRPGRL